MAKLVAQSKLDASTIDIMNVIRQNASSEYQSKVPVVSEVDDIVKVGQVIYGNPAFANQFINSLVNRIAFALMESATFNNPYRILKKGVIEFGETVEDIFVNIAQVVEYDPSKAKNREFARTFPDIRTAFYKMNWRVMYPVTVQDQDLYNAFLSVEGVTDLITKIVESIMRAYEYDEYLLFKYMIIKAVTSGKMYPVAVDNADIKNYATAFKSYRNIIQFMREDFNEAGVKNNTDDANLCVFLDANFDAQFDVNVLASAFNMDKANFIGRRFLIDDWASFDNARWEAIRQATIDAQNGDQTGIVESVTAEELAVMSKVHGIMVDERWFQVYDNRAIMKQAEVASGLYWNYFYHSWKTIAHSPFANAIVFVDGTATTGPLSSFKMLVTDVSKVGTATVVNLVPEIDDTLQSSAVQLIEVEDMIEDKVAVQKFGSYIFPKSANEKSYVLSAGIKDTNYVTATSVQLSSLTQGTEITFQKVTP